MKKLFSLLSVSLLLCGFLINYFSVPVLADTSLVFTEGNYELSGKDGTGMIQVYLKDNTSATSTTRHVFNFSWQEWDRLVVVGDLIEDGQQSLGLLANATYSNAAYCAFLYIPGLFLTNHRYDILVDFTTNMGYAGAGSGVYTNRGTDYVYNENKTDYTSRGLCFRYSFFCKKDFYGLMIGNGAKWGPYAQDSKGHVYANGVSIGVRDLNKNSDITTAVNNTTNAVVSQGEATRETIENQYDTSGTTDLGGNLDDIQNDVSGALGGIDDDVGGLQNIFSGTPPPAQMVFPAFSIMGEQVWSSQVYQFSQLEEQVGPLITAVRLILSVLVYLALINYCHKVYKKIFGGD